MKRFDAAAAAFRETLEGLDLTGAEPELRNQRELGRRAALMAVADVVWDRHLGPMLDGAAVRRLLGIRTRQALSDRVHKGRILAVPRRDGRLDYPVFQFDGARVRPGIAPIVALFRDAGVDEHTIASWFRSPQRLLRSTAPADWLSGGGDPGPAVEAARRTAARLGR